MDEGRRRTAQPGVLTLGRSTLGLLAFLCKHRTGKITPKKLPSLVCPSPFHPRSSTDRSALSPSSMNERLVGRVRGSVAARRRLSGPYGQRAGKQNNHSRPGELEASEQGGSHQVPWPFAPFAPLANPHLEPPGSLHRPQAIERDFRPPVGMGGTEAKWGLSLVRPRNVLFHGSAF